MRARVYRRTVDDEVLVAHISDMCEDFSVNPDGMLNPVKRGKMLCRPEISAQIICIVLTHDQRAVGQTSVLSDFTEKVVTPGQRAAEQLATFFIDAMMRQTVRVVDKHGNVENPHMRNMFQCGDKEQLTARLFIERVAVVGENGEDLPPDTRIWIVGCQEHRIVSALAKDSMIHASEARGRGPPPEWRNPASVNHTSVLYGAMREYLHDVTDPEDMDVMLHRAMCALALGVSEQLKVGIDAQLTHLLGPEMAGSISTRHATNATGRRFVAHTQREPGKYVSNDGGVPVRLRFPPGTTYEIVGGDRLNKLRHAPFPYGVSHFSPALEYVGEIAHAASAADPRRAARAAIHAAICGGDIPDYDQIPVRPSSLLAEVRDEHKKKIYALDSFAMLADRAATIFSTIDTTSDTIAQRVTALNLAQNGMWAAYDQCFGHLVDSAPESMRCSESERQRLIAIYDVLRAPRVAGEPLCPPELQRRVCAPGMSPLADMLAGCMANLEALGSSTNHAMIEYARTALMRWAARTELRTQIALVGAASGGKSYLCKHIRASILGSRTTTHQTLRASTAGGNHNSEVEVFEEASSTQLGVAQPGGLQTGDPTQKALATQTTGLTEALVWNPETGERRVETTLSLRNMNALMCTNESMSNIAEPMRERFDILYVALAERPYHDPNAHIDSLKGQSAEADLVCKRNRLEEALVWYVQRLESLHLLEINMLAYTVHSRRILNSLAAHAKVKSVRNNTPVMNTAIILTIRRALHVYFFSEIAESANAPPTSREEADRVFAAQIAPYLVCDEEIVYAAFAMSEHKYVNPLVKPVAHAIAHIAGYSATTEDNVLRAVPGAQRAGGEVALPMNVRAAQGEIYVTTATETGPVTDYNYVIVGTDLRDIARAAETDMADEMVRYSSNEIGSMLHAWRFTHTYKCAPRVGPRTEGPGEREARSIIVVCNMTKRVSVLAAYLDSIHALAKDEDIIAAAIASNMSQLTRAVDTVRAAPLKHAPQLFGRLAMGPRADGDAEICVFLPYNSDVPAPPGAGDWARIRAQMDAKVLKFRECVDHAAFTWHMLNLGCMAPSAFEKLRADAVAQRFAAMSLALGPPDPAEPQATAHATPAARARGLLAWLENGGRPTPRYPFDNVVAYMRAVAQASMVATGADQLSTGSSARLSCMLGKTLDEAGLTAVRARVPAALDAEWRGAIPLVSVEAPPMPVMLQAEMNALTRAYLQIDKFGDRIGFVRRTPTPAAATEPPRFHGAAYAPRTGRFIAQSVARKRTAADAELDADEHSARDTPPAKRAACSETRETPASAPAGASPPPFPDKHASARANMRAPAPVPVPVPAPWLSTGSYEIELD